MPRFVQRARRLRADSTGPEDRLWQQLRGRRLDGWKFRRQVPIAGYVADFCCLEARLTIEVDGAHHVEQALSDRKRREAIEANGFLELRFNNDEIKDRLAWVLTEIQRALDTARAQPMRDAFPRVRT